MKKTIWILFIIVSTLAAGVFVYYWQKPNIGDLESYCLSKREKCPVLWCKKVPCQATVYSPDGNMNFGECMGQTSCLPR